MSLHIYYLKESKKNTNVRTLPNVFSLFSDVSTLQGTFKFSQVQCFSHNCELHVSFRPIPDFFISCSCHSCLKDDNRDPIFFLASDALQQSSWSVLPRHCSSFNVVYKVHLLDLINIFFLCILILKFLQYRLTTP
jgi:hypothetical protein